MLWNSDKILLQSLSNFLSPLSSEPFDVLGKEESNVLHQLLSVRVKMPWSQGCQLSSIFFRKKEEYIMYSLKMKEFFYDFQLRETKKEKITALSLLFSWQPFLQCRGRTARCAGSTRTSVRESAGRNADPTVGTLRPTYSPGSHPCQSYVRAEHCFTWRITKLKTLWKSRYLITEYIF